MTGTAPAGTEAGAGPAPAEAAGNAGPSRLLVPALLFIALVVAAVGSLGAPLITSVSVHFGVSLASAQWTLTATLLAGAVATPVLGRLGTGPRRRTAMLATLGVVVTGSVLTVAPLGFCWLLAGRTAQGTGLGLTALLMATARDHLTGARGRRGAGRPASRWSRPGERDRAASAIALISVASTAGIGVGYPLAGLLTEVAGLRAAYTLGLVVTAAALVIAIVALPHPPVASHRPAALPVPTTPSAPAAPTTLPAPAAPSEPITLPASAAPSEPVAPPAPATLSGPAAPSQPAALARPATPFRPAPSGRARRGVSLDLPGAILLAAGLAALLIAVGEPGLWQRRPAVAGGLLSAAAVLLAVWAACERRVRAPLVDIGLLRHPAVARANLAMLTGGAGMYLLLTVITRYVQTPASAGYGFGVSTFVAGLALVPFSALGFAAGRVTPRLSARIGPGAVLAVSAMVVLAAFALFALARTEFAEALAAMALLGCGVGGFSAAIPAVILAATPARETASAMGVNQVVRSVGFSVGSAAGGLILAARTSAGQRFPASSGYTVAAGAGVVIMAVTAVIVSAGAWSGHRRAGATGSAGTTGTASPRGGEAAT